MTLTRIIAFCILLIVCPPVLAGDGVIISYLNVGGNSGPNHLELSTLNQHIDLLKAAENQGEIIVQPLDKLVRRLSEPNNLKQPRPVSITIDLPYLSTVEQAVPKMIEAGFPVTIFIPSGILDSGNSTYASWDALRDLNSEPLVSFAILPRRYMPLTILSESGLRRQIIDSRDRITDQFDRVLPIVSLPYGRRNALVDTTLKNIGIDYTIGRRSGVATGNQPYDLPRFIMSGHYGDPDRLRQLLKARALRVNGYSPGETDIDDTVEQVRLTGDFTDPPNCYADDSGQLPVKRQSDQALTITLPDPRLPGPIRINCLKSGGEDGGWKWFGLLYHIVESKPAG